MRLALVASVRRTSSNPISEGTPVPLCPTARRPEPRAHLGVVQEPAVQHTAQRGDADGHHAGLGCAGPGVVAHSLPDMWARPSERAGQDPGSCGHRVPSLGSPQTPQDQRSGLGLEAGPAALWAETLTPVCAGPRAQDVLLAHGALGPTVSRASVSSAVVSGVEEGSPSDWAF